MKFPKILRTFKSKDNKSDKIIEYRIQILPESRYSDAVELLKVQFLQDEAVTSSRKMFENECSRNEICNLWLETMKYGLTLACFRNDENSEELVAVNLLTVKRKDDLKDNFKVKIL